MRFHLNDKKTDMRTLFAYTYVKKADAFSVCTKNVRKTDLCKPILVVSHNQTIVEIYLVDY